MRTRRGRAAGSGPRLAGVLIVVLLLVGWWFLLRPAALGGPITLVTVSGHSMEPGMRTGDLAIVRRGGEQGPGDVVAFRVPRGDGAPGGGLVIHRVVGGDATVGLRTRGDNNDFDDPWRPTADDVAGGLVLHVPRAGRVVSALADPELAGSALAALTVFIVLTGGDARRAAGAGGPAGERR